MDYLPAAAGKLKFGIAAHMFLRVATIVISAGGILVAEESDVELLFPRIAKQVVTCWGHREFENFAADLIIDDRGDRRGLPKEVLSEILFLYALHMELFGYDPQSAFLPLSNDQYTR
jgi:hypothetical protein